MMNGITACCHTLFRAAVVYQCIIRQYNRRLTPIVLSFYQRAIPRAAIRSPVAWGTFLLVGLFISAAAQLRATRQAV